jgi:DNA (cytosine-5)-methyltransferase 1
MSKDLGMSQIGKYERLKLGSGIRVISFFTGAGGLDLGFDLAGYDVAYATDIDALCCETLKANIGGMLSKKTIIEQADIRKIDPDTLPRNIDLVIGGPPCQSFSASGRRAGGAPGRLDDRGTLFEAYCKIIDHVKPKAFLFENVRGILGTNKGDDWKAIVAAFRDIGYSISFRILDALDYGAPQQRERMIMVGHKLDTEFLFPRPLFGPDSLGGAPHITSGAALSNIFDDNENKADLMLSGGKYGHLLQLVPPGENYLHFTAKRGYPNPIFAYRSRFSDFLYKANPATQIKTLIASPGKYTGPFHWENRCFTVREYMRLQGFPDDYVFVGDRANRIKQIGNSVSPRLSYQLAISIAKQIFGRAYEQDLLPPEYRLSFDSRKGSKAAKTREIHTEVADRNKNVTSSVFSFTNYQSNVVPSVTGALDNNVLVTTEGNTAKIVVKADQSRKLFARMRLEIRHASDEAAAADAILEVSLYGEADHSIQTMWNAVDQWVIRSSNFHSLFELYGHFTEPHPVFRITMFEARSKAPIAAFAKHVSDFDNCSRYFPREHLTALFGMQFGTSSFVELVKMLRRYRFDVRCHETNIAIPKGVYMVSYPFTLPFGKQMNFAVKTDRVVEEEYLSKTMAA